MIADDYIEQFKTRSRNEPSVLTLAGTGLNGATQVAILCKIGAPLLSEFEKVNVVSGSAFSYFIVQAYIAGGLRADQFTDFEKLNRSLHGGGVVRALLRMGPVIFRRGAFFENELLGATAKNLFTDAFCARSLDSFPANLSFWAYCQQTGGIVEISTQNGFGSMTVDKLIRATASAPFLHGPFEFAGHQFLDPNFSPLSGRLIKTFFAIRHNHLLVNFKRSSTRGRTLLLQQDNSLRPGVSILRDFLLFTLGLPNRHIRNTHINALAALGG